MKIEFEWREGESADAPWGRDERGDGARRNKPKAAGLLAGLGMIVLSILVGSALIVGASVHLGRVHSPGWYAVTAIGGVALLFSLVFTWAVVRRLGSALVTRSASLRVEQYAGHPGELWLDERGVVQLLCGAETTIPWAHIARVWVTDRAVSVVSKQQRVIAVPRRSFTDDGGLRGFIEAIRGRSVGDVRCDWAGEPDPPID